MDGYLSRVNNKCITPLRSMSYAICDGGKKLGSKTNDITTCMMPKLLYCGEPSSAVHWEVGVGADYYMDRGAPTSHGTVLTRADNCTSVLRKGQETLGC